MNSCPISAHCGGCAYNGLTYPQTLELKQKKTEALLGGFGLVRPIIGMEHPFHYRNKVHQVFFRDGGGVLQSGYYAAGSHRVYAVRDCLIDDAKCQEIIATVRALAREQKLSVYDERRRTGFLRHVLVRRGFATGEIMVVLVVTDPVFHGKSRFLTALTEAHPEISSVVLNVNDRQTTMVLGEKNIPLYGPAFIEDELMGLRFRLSPSAFYQINPVQTAALYRAALDLAALGPEDVVLDAYCGIGTIGLLAAAEGAGKVIGVELNKAAVRDARVGARNNGISRAEFVAGDATLFMEELAARGEKLSAVLLDPPRSGSTERFFSACAALAPDRIVYVSCNPETQARDLAFITKKGYAVRAIQPVDMFPFTDSIETVCLLSRR